MKISNQLLKKLDEIGFKHTIYPISGSYYILPGFYEVKVILGESLITISQYSRVPKYIVYFYYSDDVDIKNLGNNVVIIGKYIKRLELGGDELEKMLLVSIIHGCFLTKKENHNGYNALQIHDFQ